MGNDEFPHSRNRVDTYGRKIRHAVRDGKDPPQECLDLVDEFRLWHVPTVEWIQSDLVEFLTADLVNERVTTVSRLKTSPAIVQKLCRSTTALSRMQDIAGARIVVPDLELQDRLAREITDLLGESVIDVKDQRDEPDDYGYRMLHVIGFRDERYFEVQIRSFEQDRWAQIVERIDSNYSYDLKHGRGPADWLQWLHVLSDELRKADLGEPYEIPPTPIDLLVDVDET
jgi:ppGpp synthetase/RelA/SpoT-type nucleotidyltranferase